jgi:enoyl-CoA hydratase/carnithine racemase
MTEMQQQARALEFVEYEQDGPVVTIRLNRPERMNSLSRALVADLEAAWDRFILDEDARVAIYTGTGKAFCAGMDVKEAATADRSEVRVPEPPLTIFHAGDVQKPIVAAVNGYAIGGGFFDVLRCDLRIAAESAVFQLAEVMRSVMPHPLINGIAGALPDCLVTELALGERLTARRAYEMGLINRVVADDELKSEARRVADAVAALPPLAVASVLEGLRRARALRHDDRELRRWQENATRRLLDSEDYREALTSFLEKRTPAYKGR